MVRILYLALAGCSFQNESMVSLDDEPLLLQWLERVVMIEPLPRHYLSKVRLADIDLKARAPDRSLQLLGLLEVDLFQNCVCAEGAHPPPKVEHSLIHGVSGGVSDVSQDDYDSLLHHEPSKETA